MTRRVLSVCHNHPAVRPGGAEAYAYELHRSLAATPGYQSIFLAKGGPPVGYSGSVHSGTCFGPTGEGEDEYFFYTDGYDFDYLLGTQPGKDLYTRHFRGFLQAYEPDIVHFQHTLFLGFDLIREVRNVLPDTPIVYTLHEYLPICHRNGQMVRTGSEELCHRASPRRCHECFPSISPQTFFLRERFIKSHLSLVDVFIAPSEFLRQRYIEWGIPAERIRTEEYGRRPAGRTARTPDRPQRDRLGFFGQLSGFKGVDVLLEAMRILEREADGAATGERGQPGRLPQLRVHGANLELQPGEFQNRFDALLEDTRSSVTFVGKYDHEHLPGLMEHVDWVVVPSVWWENSPLVIQEAFLHRRPVICSDIGGMAEKVTDGVNGLHFAAGDPASLAETIARATGTSGLWQQLRDGIPAVYDMTQHIDELDRLYTALLAGRDAEDVAHVH
jgi:glycosyltransferase involved in cell wall biosynthesis